MDNITFYLCDTSSDIAEGWSTYFSDMNNFQIHLCDIISLFEKLYSNIGTECNIIIVSPANSFGDMQGGVDLKYYEYFGYNVEKLLQFKILNEKSGELIIGDYMIVDCEKHHNTKILAAPTMRVPCNITNTINVYLAFRAVLLGLANLKNTFRNTDKVNKLHVIVPGLGTGIGKISGNISAKQMYYAYISIVNPRYNLDLADLTNEHITMLKEDY